MITLKVFICIFAFMFLWGLVDIIIKKIFKNKADKVENNLAGFFINIIYLVFPAMHFYAIFHQGDNFYFDIMKYLTIIFCFFLGLWAKDDSYYFGDSNGILFKVFFGIVIFYILSLLKLFSIPRNVWNVIDFIVGGFFLFYFFRYKKNRKRFDNKQINNTENEVD